MTKPTGNPRGRPPSMHRGGPRTLHQSREGLDLSDDAAKVDSEDGWQGWVRGLIDKRIRQLQKSGKLPA